MDMLLPDSDEEESDPPRAKVLWELKAPSEQQWASLLLDEDRPETPPPVGRGQVQQITPEVEQDREDPSLFHVDGKDRSWFLQKGALLLERASPSRFRVDVIFQGGPKSRFGDDYAELSRAEQADTMNWLLAVGVARSGVELTGYRDCKTSGYYFILHANYRRTRWRVIASPHNAELEDVDGKLYSCNPQDANQFEIEAFEGQTLSVEYAENELWILEGGSRRARGHWVFEDDETVPCGKLPPGDYRPAVLTSNCPTSFHARVVSE
eukprot:TRINITY_DN28098_c0_g1_i1.p1 TRINITY_DN28098_c0_g1~~TRINITY_DN28098_c0_g1_i1.p1  ORF type:complete len:290 (+),score=51.92 TRINITY_DN28098_c0_g1_i1:75-872(+)